MRQNQLERWHRTCRDQFLSELDARRITDLADLNARLWAWLEQVYHQSGHAGLGGMTPLARYQRDLPRIRSLGAKAAQLDALFHHRRLRQRRLTSGVLLPLPIKRIPSGSMAMV